MDVCKLRRHTVGLRFQVDDDGVLTEICGLPHLQSAPEINDALAIVELGCEPAETSATKVSSDHTIYVVHDTHVSHSTLKKQRSSNLAGVFD